MSFPISNLENIALVFKRQTIRNNPVRVSPIHAQVDQGTVLSSFPTIFSNQPLWETEAAKFHVRDEKIPKLVWVSRGHLKVLMLLVYVYCWALL